jgi:zinc transport system permease protein
VLDWPEPFILRAFLAAVGLAVIAAPMGCVVVWRRMSYVGETLAQVGLLGVALGLAARIDLTLAVVVAAVVAAGTLVLIGRQRMVPLDSALGLMHHATLSLGIVAIAVAKGPAIDLMSYLFGDVFAVTGSDLVWIYAGGAGVLSLVLYLWTPLLRLSLHDDLAIAEGVDPRLRAAFDLLLAVVIAIAMKIVGILLVMAFLVVPAVAARPASETPERMAILAAAVAILSVVIGLWLSLSSDIPGGPSIVIAMCAIAAISLLAGSRRQR